MTEVSATVGRTSGFFSGRAGQKRNPRLVLSFRSPEGEKAMRTIKPNFLLAFVLALVAAGIVPLSQLASASGQAQTTTAAPPRPGAPQAAAARITTPKEEWGFNVGDDYFLANYQQLTAYWRKLEKESPRIHIEEIGRTAMKKPHLMAIITAPENYKNLAKYKDISRRLSLAEGPDRRTGARARARRQVGRLDRRRAARVRSARRAAAAGNRLPAGVGDRRRDDADPERRHRARRLGEPGRDGPRFGRLHETHRHDGRASGPLQLLRGARQQPRLVHERAARDHQHEPDHVSRVVPAGHVQPPPVGSRRARSCSRRRSAIRTTSTSIRSSSRGSISWARRCTRASSPRASRA